jgi:hypothetical protein
MGIADKKQYNNNIVITFKYKTLPHIRNICTIEGVDLYKLGHIKTQKITNGLKMKTFNKIIHSTVIISLMLIYSACEKGYQPRECNYNIHIPDTAFKNALLNTWVIHGDDYENYLDINKDGEICDGEAYSLEWLFINDSNIRNIEGIEHFKNLSWLDCNECNIESISFNSNSLKKLECDNNLLSNLDISNMKNLEELSCNGNKLTKLNLSENLA